MDLSKAKKEGKLDQFIEEHKKDAKGDKKKFKRLLDSMTKTQKEVQETSSQDNDGN